MGEGLGVFYSFFISYMIEYIKDETIEYKWGFIYVAIFFFANLFSLVLRAQYLHWGTIMFLQMRRTLCNAMFNKVERLSIKSLSETESGKLVAIISSDLFAIEGGMALRPIIVGGPVITVCTIIFIAFYYTWWFAIVVLVIWVITFTMQMGAGAWSNSLKSKEAECTD